MRKTGKSAEEIFEVTTKLRNEAKILARELVKDKELRETHEGHFQTTIRFEDRLGRIA